MENNKATQLGPEAGACECQCSNECRYEKYEFSPRIKRLMAMRGRLVDVQFAHRSLMCEIFSDQAAEKICEEFEKAIGKATDEMSKEITDLMEEDICYMTYPNMAYDEYTPSTQTAPQTL